MEDMGQYQILSTLRQVNNVADQLFKKRQGKKQQRKEAIKEIAPYRYLIVCEGKKTEPYYFEGIKRLINAKYGNKIIVNQIKVERIDIDGTGRNTEDLVKYAIEKRKNAEIPYGHVWCVFDKDSFTDEQFNNAIIQAEANDLEVAWSNEAIELWFILHFEYMNTEITREQYINKLDEYFVALSINSGKYEKNLTDIYDILTQQGDLNKAIKHAKRLESLYSITSTPASRKPSTTVYALVEELYEYLRT